MGTWPSTAAIDLETDNLIQTAIRKEFEGCTIITIAHRLNTVLDYDRILVLKDGNVAEMDSPKQLMQTEGSIFRGMCQVGFKSDPEINKHFHQFCSGCWPVIDVVIVR